MKMIAADFLRMFDEQLERSGEKIDQTPVATYEIAHVLAVYTETLREGSNRSLDWLWLAEKLPLREDRRYCIEQALLIDPNCPLANAALARLNAGQRLLK